MLVRNLVPWAGLDFSLAPGDTIDLPDETATARIAAGLAAAIEETPPAKPAKRSATA